MANLEADITNASNLLEKQISRAYWAHSEAFVYADMIARLKEALTQLERNESGDQLALAQLVTTAFTISGVYGLDLSGELAEMVAILLNEVQDNG